MLDYTVTRSEGHEGGGGIGVASVSLAHPNMAPGLLPALLPLGGYNIADQDHVTGAPGFQGDGVHPEVLEHIENGLEPQVLHPAVTLLIQRQAQVLGLALEVEGEDVFAPPRLTLPDQEHPVGAGASCQHQLGGLWLFPRCPGVGRGLRGDVLSQQGVPPQ